jgi:hypothetical protein
MLIGPIVSMVKRCVNELTNVYRCAVTGTMQNIDSDLGTTYDLPGKLAE